jgi:probable O-glycosylation ligase (exosortase A-associated)
VAFFNPHRYAYALAKNTPVAMIIAIPTILGMLFTRDTNHKIFSRETSIILALWAWFGITLVHASLDPFLAGHVADGLFTLNRVSKILLMSFATFYLVNTKNKLRGLLLLVAVSFAVLDVKSGIWGILTKGQFRLTGPEDSFLEDNNSFGLASNMAMPLMFFLAKDETRKWLRYFLYAGFFFGGITVILTYSRGGLLGLAVVMLGVVLKSRHKLIGIAFLVLAGMATMAYSPGEWQERMSGFLHGQVDSSAEQRLVTWGVGLKIVENYPITGGGLEVYPDEKVFQTYKQREMPGGRKSAGPHSIYLQMIGEQGIVGFLLFLGLIASCLLTARKVRRRARSDPEGEWVANISYALEVGIYGFLVSGATLGLANFDLWYLFVICVSLLNLIYFRDLALRQADARFEATEPIVMETAHHEVVPQI